MVGSPRNLGRFGALAFSALMLTFGGLLTYYGLHQSPDELFCHFGPVSFGCGTMLGFELSALAGGLALIGRIIWDYYNSDW